MILPDPAERRRVATQAVLLMSLRELKTHARTRLGADIRVSGVLSVPDINQVRHFDIIDAETGEPVCLKSAGLTTIRGPDEILMPQPRAWIALGAPMAVDVMFSFTSPGGMTRAELAGRLQRIFEFIVEVERSAGDAPGPFGFDPCCFDGLAVEKVLIGGEFTPRPLDSFGICIPQLKLRAN